MCSHIVEHAGGAQSDVIFCRVVFGSAVGKILLCTFPADMELILSLAVAQPAETHVHGFGSTLDDGVSEDTDSAFVIELKWGWALWMAHFLQGRSDGHSVFGIDETGTSF